jgi:drug/metabolite transporter (DMT)-like permease
LQHLLGGLAALGSAFLFALASIFFRRLGARVSPVGVNLGKGSIAVVLTAALLLVTGMDAVPWKAGVLLGVSGLLGITVGDTAYFTALNHLGARRTLVLDALSPVTTVFLAVGFLGERPGLVACLGIALTVSGVTLVLRERLDESNTGSQAGFRRAVLWGVMAVVCHAIGVVVSKVALEVVPALEASLVRQVVGLAGLGFYVGVTRQAMGTLAPLREKQNLVLLMAASFCGTFLGIWFALIALQLIDASVATTLNSTGPIFILPLVWLIEKERISPRAILASLVAVAGVALLLLG